MKLNASIVSRTVAAKRGASTYAHKVAAHLEPGQTIHFADGSQVRVLSTRTSTDGLRMRVATSDGERNLSARQFVEMGPVSPSMTRLAAFVRRVVAYEAVLDDYIKEAIKAAQLPVDEAMNWSGYLERLYGPLLNSLTKDASLRDDAVRDMVVYELYEKNMLSDGSVHAHFNPDHPNFQGKELKHKVTAYLISLFKYRKSRVADSLRRSLGVGMVGAQGLSRTEGMDILGKDDDSLENGVGDLVRNQNLTVDRTPADISRIEGDDEVSQFLNAYKDYINETQVGSSAKTLNFITDAFASGMSKVEMKDAIVGKPEFQGRNGDPLDAHTYNYLLRKWGEFIRAFAEDPEYGWNESPVARMIAQNAAKEKKLKAPKKVLTTSSLHLAVGVQEKEEIEEELIDQLEKTQLPPAAVKPPSPNVAQQEAVAANPKTPTLQNGVDPDKPKLTIPPEIPGVNHNASVFEEKDMTTIERLMAHERRASMAPKAAASRTPVKFASLRRIAETEPQEVAQALGDLGDSFTRMASQLAALKDNLDLAEAPKEASIRQKVAHRNRYASTLRRLATEAPEELATALTEFYGQLDGLAGELENFAGNIGVELGPTGDELGTEGEAPAMEEEEPLEDDFQAVPEARMAGRKQAARPGRAIQETSWPNVKRTQRISATIRSGANQMTIDKNSTDQELMDAFEAGNNAGNGFSVGETTDSPFEAADREEYVILRNIEGGTNNPGEPVFCEDGDDLIVIANVNGPWAVTVGKVVGGRGVESYIIPK